MPAATSGRRKDVIPAAAVSEVGVVGAANPTSFINILMSGGHMARQYRQLIEHHKENLSGAGDFNSFARIFKDDNRKGGYADKVVIHYVVEDRTPQGGDTDSPNLLSNMGFGCMFVASLSNSRETVDSESGLLDPDDILHIRCRDGVAGSVTLPIKHLIKQNDEDTAEKDGAVTLWVKYPDVTVDDNILIRFYIEGWGRWIRVAGV